MGFIIILIIALLFTAAYAVLIETYRRWFVKVPLLTLDLDSTPSTTFSVIIPARNEEENIQACLTSVLGQNYPPDLFEVILVDDHSTDDTVGIAKTLQQRFPNLQVIKLHEILEGKALNSYKKKAIEVAITRASKDWIVTTDADCMVGADWLTAYDQFIQRKLPVFVAAPVRFTSMRTFVSIFQSLDFMSLQGITAAAVQKGFHSMCNGANLAYNRAVFNEVGGFAGIDKIASGDDMLLMHKIYKKFPKQLGFLLAKEAIVQTAPMQTWRAFFNQRIRWASKADKFEDKRIFFVLLFIYLYNCLFMAIPIAGIWFPTAWLVWLIMLVCKTIIELTFITPVAKFFNVKKMLWWFPIMQPVHIAYTVIAGWLGKFGKYSWKGRTVK